MSQHYKENKWITSCHDLPEFLKFLSPSNDSEYLVREAAKKILFCRPPPTPKKIIGEIGADL